MNLYKTNQKFYLRFILILVSLIIMSLSFFGFFRYVPVFDIFSVPIGNFVSNNQKNLSIFFSKFEEDEKLFSANLELQKELTKIHGQLALNEEYKREIDSLKRLLKVYTPTNNMVYSQKISQELSDKMPVAITINKGFSDGIKTGLMVINDSGVFVGTVAYVTAFTSIVTPYYADAEIKLPIRNQKNQTANIIDFDQGKIIGQFTVQNEATTIGDLFITIALSDRVKGDLFVGKLGPVDDQDKRKFILETDIISNSDNLYILL